MCARYELCGDKDVLRTLLDDLARRGISWRGGEVYPSSCAPVLLEAGGELVPALKCWGFPWPGRRPVNKARAETLLDRPMFRDAALKRRCAAPASSVFEWDEGQQKFRFSRRDGELLYLAAVWDRRDGMDCYCIITTAADEDVAPVHQRMPLVLRREQLDRWLRSEAFPSELLEGPPPQLLRIRADGQLGLW